MTYMSNTIAMTNNTRIGEFKSTSLTVEESKRRGSIMLVKAALIFVSSLDKHLVVQ